MKVLVTGSRGYLGTLLVRLLRKNGFFVVGCDIGLASPSEWYSLYSANENLSIDFRFLKNEHLDECDCVVHLAGLPNDACSTLPSIDATAININATIDFATISKFARVKKFIFASSSSVYENSNGTLKKETDLVNPQSFYAKSKYNAELGLKEISSNSFNVACLRFGTAYGHSPSLRMDLVLNAMLFSALSKKKIFIFGDPYRCRPLISANYIVNFLSHVVSTSEWINEYLCLNVGCNQQNYSLFKIAEKVKEFSSKSEIIIQQDKNSDSFDYSVDSSLAKKCFFEFQAIENIEYEIDVLAEHIKEYGISRLEKNMKSFIRKHTYSRLLPQDRMDQSTCLSTRSMS